MGGYSVHVGPTRLFPLVGVGLLEGLETPSTACSGCSCPSCLQHPLLSLGQCGSHGLNEGPWHHPDTFRCLVPSCLRASGANGPCAFIAAWAQGEHMLGTWLHGATARALGQRGTRGQLVHYSGHWGELHGSEPGLRVPRMQESCLNRPFRVHCLHSLSLVLWSKAKQACGFVVVPQKEAQDKCGGPGHRRCGQWALWDLNYLCPKGHSADCFYSSAKAPHLCCSSSVSHKNLDTLLLLF